MLHNSRPKAKILHKPFFNPGTPIPSPLMTCADMTYPDYSLTIVA